MQMAKGMDTGDILLQKEVVLDEKETGGSLFDRLMETGADRGSSAQDRGWRAYSGGTEGRTGNLRRKDHKGYGKHRLCEVCRDH